MPPRRDGQQGAGHRGRDRKLHFRGDPHFAAGKWLGRLRKQTIAVDERRGIECAGRRELVERRRHRALGDIDLMVGEVRECRYWQAEILGQHLVLGVS
jgi:hypothetical protein